MLSIVLQFILCSSPSYCYSLMKKRVALFRNINWKWMRMLYIYLYFVWFNKSNFNDIYFFFLFKYTGSQESVLEIEEAEFRRPRSGLIEHEIVLVQNQRRHSGVRVAISRDCATSPCSFSSVDPDAVVVAEQSFGTSASVDVSDVAVNTSDPPSEADYDSSEDRWTSPFPRSRRSSRIHEPSDDYEFNDDDESIIKTDEETFEVCDSKFEN